MSVHSTVKAAIMGLLLSSSLSLAKETPKAPTPPPAWAVAVGPGLHAPFLRIEGLPPLVMPGGEIALSFQSTSLQVRPQFRFFASTGTLRTGAEDTARTISFNGYAWDASLRLAGGSFSPDDSLFAFIQPGIFQTWISRQDSTGALPRIDVELTQIAADFGLGTIRKIGSRHLEFSASVARLATDPQTLKVRLHFVPGLFVSFWLGG